MPDAPAALRAALGILAACLGAHVVLAQLIPSPWGVPNLTLIGLILASGRSPRHAVWFGGWAGLSAMLWAIRAEWQLLLGYLLAGWAIRRLGRPWDVAEPKVQLAITGLLGVALVTAALWLEGLWSVPVTVLAVVHVSLTIGTLWMIRAWPSYG